VLIERVDEPTDELAAALARLVPQLSQSAPPITAGHLAELASSPATVLFVARDGSGEIIGTLTLVLVRIPTGLMAIIEDVVVDGAVRGGGVGGELVREAVAAAREAGARKVDLTSRPSRVEANRLYEKLGFQRRDTNVYRYPLGET
jgi:ribosomal protein S18 acetylase RimI-like enzyme